MMKSFIEYFLLFLTCYFSLIFSANTADNQNLRSAARNGDLNLVRELVFQGRGLADCEDALIRAARYGHLEVVRFLVTEGPEETRALANCQDGEALIFAAATAIEHDSNCRYENLEVIRFLVTEGPEESRALANSRNGEALILAARSGHLELVRFLVTEGPEESRALANSRNGEVLILAAGNGHSELVRFLVTEGPEESRALANSRNGEALVLAAGNGHSEVVRELLEMSINTDNLFPEDQFLQALNADAIQNLDEHIRNELEDIFHNVHLK